MDRQGRNQAGSTRNLVAALLLLACCLGAALGAPRLQKLVRRPTTLATADPLLAMATDGQYIQMSSGVQAQQPQEQEVYLQQPQSAEQPATELRQEVYYVSPESYQQPQVLVSQQQYQEVHEVHEQPDQQANNQRQQEYVLVQQQQQQPQQQVQQQQQVEYPGQIVYVGQNGEISKVIQESQAPRQAQEQMSQSIGDMVSPSSALPATILTEVPLKDLAGDVLDKLKRDYGVKVVATRDRPGANLVINCDDNGQEPTSICAKPDRNNNNNNGSPYAVEASTGPIEEQLAQVMASAPVYSGPSSRSYFLRGSTLDPTKAAPALEVTTTGQDIQRHYAAYIQEQPTGNVNPEVLDKSQYDDESSQQARQQVAEPHQQQMAPSLAKEEADQAHIEVEQQQHQYNAEQTN